MAERGAVQPGRVAIAALLAILVAFQAVRTAAVADRQDHPGRAAALWAAHPAVLADKVLLDVAKAAARAQSVPAATRQEVQQIAAKAPLAPDPYVITGAIAETEGHGDVSERLLLAARARDPRSRAARYLLAERFLRTGRVTAALIEMHALVGLQSGGLEVFIPALVAYAKTPGAVPQLKAFLTRYPWAEDNVLAVLALDAANADLALELETDRNPKAQWRARLVATLVAAGQYGKAYAIWTQTAGTRARYGIYNPGFAQVSAPPPFNWSFAETPEGVAEPDGKGGLELLYYGRTPTVLASQMLLLRPGHYSLSNMVADVSGEASALHWVLRCANPQGKLVEAPLRQGPTVIELQVPPDCQAVILELAGVAGESPRTTGLTVRNLRLQQGRSQ